MGRKGDIVSKVIGVRAPIKVYTKLLNESSDKGISLSEYCVSLLTKDNFSQGGQTKIEYIDRPPRIVEKNVPIDNPVLIKENSLLKKEIKSILLISIGAIEHPTQNKDEILDLLKEKAENYKAYMD
jgi:hypothetical protein